MGNMHMNQMSGGPQMWQQQQYMMMQQQAAMSSMMQMQVIFHVFFTYRQLFSSFLWHFLTSSSLSSLRLLYFSLLDLICHLRAACIPVRSPSSPYCDQLSYRILQMFSCHILQMNFSVQYLRCHLFYLYLTKFHSSDSIDVRAIKPWWTPSTPTLSRVTDATTYVAAPMVV